MRRPARGAGLLVMPSTVPDARQKSNAQTGWNFLRNGDGYGSWTHLRRATIPCVHPVPLAIAALFPGLATLPTERLDIASFDGKGRLVGVSRYDGASAVGICVPLRILVRDMLGHDASSIIIAHNHPSGNPMASKADRAFTSELWFVLKPLSIRIDDHFIFARDASFSFRSAGLL